MFVYILSNSNHTAFYVGVTNELFRRIKEHKAGMGSQFSRKYNLTCLLYFEEFASSLDAIAREKQLKNWHRNWKLNLIRKNNPDMADLAGDWFTHAEIIAWREEAVRVRRGF